MISLKSKTYALFVMMAWASTMFLLLKHLQHGILERSGKNTSLPQKNLFLNVSQTNNAVLKGRTRHVQKKPVKVNSLFLPSQPKPMDSIEIAWEPKRQAIRSMFQEAWSVYKKHAFGCDEVLPISMKCGNKFGNIGTTVIDSLDSLILFGLEDEFEQGVAWIAESYTLERSSLISVFETTIRNLGGLLSAYSLRPNHALLEAAEKTGEWLLNAYTTPSGLPAFAMGPGESPKDAKSTSLADAGTQLLEHSELSHITKRRVFKDSATRGFTVLLQELEKRIREGNTALLPVEIQMDGNSLSFGNSFSMGPRGDSFYEYLIKLWIYGGKSESMQRYRLLWEATMDAMIENLLVQDTGTGFVYLGDRKENAKSTDGQMHHLACFVPGMLALGAEGRKTEKYLQVAKDLAFTCWRMYQLQSTKLAADSVSFSSGRLKTLSSHHYLRPEVVESLFYLWRRTGDPMYREWAWEMAKAWNHSSRVETGGFTTLADVSSGKKDDYTPSFFYAETLKYLYLIFCPNNVIPLNEYVFNTEAHPFPIRRDEKSLRL